MQRQFGLRVGSIVTVPFYSLSQREVEISTNDYVVPHGPRVSFRIVGVEVSEGDFPSTSPSYSLYTSPAFDHGEGRTVVSVPILQMRLRQGPGDMPQLQVFVNHHQPKHGFAYLQNEDSSAASIGQWIQPQATGWWFFASSPCWRDWPWWARRCRARASSSVSPTPRSRRSDYVRVSSWTRHGTCRGRRRCGGVGRGGAGVCRLPADASGQARAAATQRGFVFDPVLLSLGFLAIVALVVALAVLPSRRAAFGVNSWTTRDQPVSRSSSTVALFARSGAPPSVLVGVRNALDRGRGRSSVPVATALVGATVAVMALVATTVFGASLNHLVKTPPLYGQNWQLDMGSMSTSQLHTAITEFDHDARVTKVSYGFTGKYVKIGSVVVEGVFVGVAKGPMAFSLVSGHDPVGTHEMLLGATTMSQTHLHLGSRVSVSLVNKANKVLDRTFRVVGVVSLPPTFSNGGLGVGVVMPLNAALDIACKGNPDQSTCKTQLVKSISGWGMAVGITPGAAGRAALAHYDKQFSQNVNELNVPTNLFNFGQAVDFPLLLGVTLALFGAATLAHLLFVSVARRRRQVALLKVLGFVRHQVLAATCFQALTVVVIGLVIGVPTGIVVGGTVWRTFASHLGAVPVAVVPARVVAIVCGVIVVGGVALALLPALLALRVQPGEALREA